MLNGKIAYQHNLVIYIWKIYANQGQRETIILKSNMKYETKALSSNSYEFNVCKIQNIFELPEKRWEQKSVSNL